MQISWVGPRIGKHILLQIMECVVLQQRHYFMYIISNQIPTI